MKTCFKCGTIKPLSDFYTHPRMADGHLNKCIPCARKDVADRAAAPTTQETRERWNERNGHKRKAHLIMQRALKSGRLVRASFCEECGTGGRIEGHHHDYRKPLDVKWLCVKCHGKTRHKPAPIYKPSEFDLIP